MTERTDMSNEKTDEYPWPLPDFEVSPAYHKSRSLRVLNAYETHNGSMGFYDPEAPKDDQPWEVTQQGQTINFELNEAETRAFVAAANAAIAEWDAYDEQKRSRK